jgi:hypothetical protein
VVHNPILFAVKVAVSGSERLAANEMSSNKYPVVNYGIISGALGIWRSLDVSDNPTGLISALGGRDTASGTAEIFALKSGSEAW